jgi:hypothetical protein
MTYNIKLAHLLHYIIKMMALCMVTLQKEERKKIQWNVIIIPMVSQQISFPICTGIFKSLKLPNCQSSNNTAESSVRIHHRIL